MYLSNDQIDIIKNYFSDKPVNKLYLFGSYARGDADQNSDIDLVFSLHKGTRISYFGLAKYLIELEKKLNKKIDLVEEELLYPRIKSIFDREKKIIL
jgi:predicted nucleotidyltransferase